MPKWTVDCKAFHRGVELFNHAEFFEAHEVWEDVWRAAPSQEKKFLQGLIQIAVGLHHHFTGNRIGAQSLLARGSHNLSAYTQNSLAIDLPHLLEAVSKYRHALTEGILVPDPPRIHLLESE